MYLIHILQAFTPAKAIPTALAVLLAVRAFLTLLRANHCNIQVHQTAKGVSQNFEALVDLLDTIENFLKHLDIYTEIPPTSGMNEIIFKVVVELLSTLALATKELNQGRPSMSFIVEVLRHSALHREIRKKAFWRKRRRRGPTKARTTHPRRGSDDRNRDPQGYLWSCTGYE
jgi:hypothetical protein